MADPKDPDSKRQPETLTLGPGGSGTLSLGPAAAGPAPTGVAATRTLGAAAPTLGAAAATWQPGNTIGGLFDVRSVLGEGGFGSVYKVYHRGWDLEMAVKSPRADRVSSRAAAEAFVQEANTWVGLGLHPHIVTCYFVRLMGLPRIFIEYMEGGSLADWIKGRRIREGKMALDIAIQACRALAYAHGKGLVHRDLKPGNCLMTPGGTLKVTDFGLAKINELELEEASQAGAKIARVKGATATGRLGTPEYMAPEQWDKPREAGKAADAWAFGVMLYELCLGKKPFLLADDEPIDSFYARLLSTQWAYAKPAKIPRELADLMTACLTVAPGKRPTDFDKVGAALEAIYEKVAGSKYVREAAKPAALADTLNNQGVSLADLGHAQEALRLFDEALKIDPTHPGATYNRGTMLAGAGKVSDSDLLSRLAQAKKARPDDWTAPFLLGLVHLRREDAGSALRELDEAQALSRHHRNPLVAQARTRAEAKAFAGPAELFVALPTGSEGAAMERSAFKALITRAERELAEGHCAQAQELIHKARQVKGYERAAEAIELSHKLAAKGTRAALKGCWQKRSLEGSEGAVSVAVSADGFLWTGHEGNVLKRWDPSTGACVETGKGGGAPSTRALTPDKRFAVEAAGRTLKIAEQPPGARSAAPTRGSAEFESDAEIAAVALSAEGCTAYTAGKAGVRAWELDWEYAFEERGPEGQRARSERPGPAWTRKQLAAGGAVGLMVVGVAAYVLWSAAKQAASPPPWVGPNRDRSAREQERIVPVRQQPAAPAPRPEPPPEPPSAAADQAKAEAVADALFKKGQSLQDSGEATARFAASTGLNNLAKAGKVAEAAALARQVEAGESLMDQGRYAEAAKTFSAALALPGGELVQKLLSDAKTPEAERKRRERAMLEAKRRGQSGIDWVPIPGGSFTMGSDENADERPRHRVAVPSFQMARTEVTNRQYRACVEAGACTAAQDFGAEFRGDDQPVVGVDWNQA